MSYVDYIEIEITCKDQVFTPDPFTSIDQAITYLEGIKKQYPEEVKN